ncbi:MAG: hypothetical protein PHH77_07535 [Victivallaceae bacterium]|nr:hypothetical protein [Victivallaceae bacterium]
MAENISWGISFSSLESADDLPRELPEDFSVLELPGFMLPLLAKKKLKLSYPHISGLFWRELLDPAVSREIITQSASIRNELQIQVRQLIAETGRLNSSGILLDFAIERGFGDPGLAEKIRAFINGFSHTLYHTNGKLLFPVRLPLAEGVESAEQYLEFLKKQMLPQAGFSLDLHPHELAARRFSPDEIMRWLKFDTVMLRFVYEPETGNRLVPKSIEPWLKYSRQHHDRLKIIFAPVGRHSETLENEINSLTQLIPGLNNP